MAKVRAEPVPEIPGMFRVYPKGRFTDHRGTLQEAFNLTQLRAALELDPSVGAGGAAQLSFVQENHIVSGARGVLRGLHFQCLSDRARSERVPLGDKADGGQIKLVRPLRGRMLDIVVDTRGGAAYAESFGQFSLTELDAAAEDGPVQVLVPAGCSHGVLCLSEGGCEASYLLTAHHDPEREGGACVDDPLLLASGLELPIPWAELIRSEKDKSHPPLASRFC